MRLRTIGPLLAMLGTALVGGCPAQPNVLDQATPDSGSTTDAASGTPTTDASAAQPSQGNDAGAAATPPADASSGGAPANDAPAGGSPGDVGGNASASDGDGGDGAAGDSGNVGDAGNAGDTGDVGDAGGAAADTGGGTTGGDGGGAALRGTFRGTLTGTRHESLNGGTPSSFDRTVPISVTFNPSGKPLAILVPGFATTPDLSFEVQDVGDEQTRTGASSGIDYTVTVRVTRAVYTATTVELDLEITVQGQGGSLTEDGTGTQQIRMNLNSDGTLAYSSLTRYEVVQQAGSISFNTTQVFDDQGTLTPQ